MPPKTTLNAKNLEALGAERLAALLMQVSAGDAAAKRKLRMALVGLQAPGEVSREIRAARLKGYQGDACGECGNFTLVRNGTRLKCDTCGSTTGCS
ncbi:MAG: DUF6880 family protein [Alphaproteobacteria bacterium]